MARTMNRQGMPCGLPPQMAAMPNSLYHSLQGQYFTGYADDMYFDPDKNAWALLFNPPGSGVNLYVVVWTMTDLYAPATRVEIWLNSRMPGGCMESPLVSTTNFAIKPQPEPRVKLLQASNVAGQPEGGAKVFARRSQPGETIYKDEEGKWIIPPGGSFGVFISNTVGENIPAYTRVAFGWWEEKIRR